MSGVGRGRPKKKRRGKEPELANAEGDAVGYRSLSENSKKAYKKTKLDENNPPAPAPPTSRRRAVSLDQTASAASGSQSVGRPPLNPEKGAMRESSLKKRRADLNKKTREDQRKEDHISQVRRQAVSSRKDRQVPEAVHAEHQVQGRDLDPSERTIFRTRAEFSKILPPSLISQAELLVKFVEDGLLPELSVVTQPGESKQTPKSSFYRYHGQIVKFLDHLKKRYSSLSHDLLLSWAQTLIKSDRHIFAQANLSFLNPKDIPATVLSQLASDKIKEEMMSVKWGKLLHDFTITHAIRVCKEVSCWKNHEFGEIIGLANAVGVSKRFAAKVISAVRLGEEAKLFKRKVRCDSLRGSSVIEDLVLFLQEERNSRSCPGATVSVAYKVRRAKFLLCESKKNLLKLFFLKTHSTDSRPLHCSRLGLKTSKLQAVVTESGMHVPSTQTSRDSNNLCIPAVLASTLPSPVELPQHLPCVTKLMSFHLTP